MCEERKCSSCNNIKSIEEFSKKKDGEYYKWCEICREKGKLNYEIIKHIKNEKSKQYREKNKKVIKEREKLYYKENKDVISKRKKQYREKNLDFIKYIYRKFYQKNKNKLSIKKVKYRNSLALYDSWYNKLNTYEECKQDPNDVTLLQVKCTKCGEWFNPTNGVVSGRLQCISGVSIGERRFYCSQECKDNCEIYKRRKYPKGMNPYSKREGSTKLRKIVLERDENTCQKCYSKDNLECHHIVPVKLDKALTNDPDNCITLCHDCHVQAHSDYDCTTGYLASL